MDTEVVSPGVRREGNGHSRKGRYGLDAPYLIVLPALGVVLNIGLAINSGRPWGFVGAALIALCAGFGWHSSRRGKFVVWEEILDGLRLDGGEQVLDVGCGRGAVLMMAAKHLTTGHATGVDLWRRWDQSGNAMEATQRNADAEGVAARVSLQTGDMTALPFQNQRFDLVLSSLAVHNVPSRAARAQAVTEMTRVLRHGGRVAIADLRAITEYRDRLTELGMIDIAVRDLGWRMWWGGPWVSTRLITARRP